MIIIQEGGTTSPILLSKMKCWRVRKFILNFRKSISPIKEFMIDGLNYMFGRQNITNFNFPIPQKVLGGSMKINLNMGKNVGCT